MQRKALDKMTREELLAYIDDTSRLMTTAAAEEKPGLVKFYAGWIRSATKRLR